MEKKLIVEKRLGIPSDYQYKAINSWNFIQANWHRNKFTVVDHYLGQGQNKDVLDLGTGSGNFELLFNKKFRSILGVDYNDEALGFLQKKLSEGNITNVKLMESDIREFFSLRNEKYDAIVLIDVIEHLEIEQVNLLVHEFSKHLNPDGEVFVITPNYKSLWNFIELLLDQIGVVPKFNGEQHLSKFYKKNLNDTFAENGFKTQRFFSFNLFSYLLPSRSLSKYLCLFESYIPLPIGNLICGIYKLK